MAIITKSISFTGEEESINLALDALALRGGFTESAESLSKLECAEKTIRQMILDIVRSVEFEKAKSVAEEGLESLSLVQTVIS